VTLTAVDTPLGRFGAEFSARGLRTLRFPDEDSLACDREGGDAARRLGAELNAYLGGRLKVFSVPLDLRGTEFQLSVWQALLEIPYGSTRSYAELAAGLGRPDAVRAVGSANASNPVPILVPCHRVIGSSGSLTGYGGGLDLKRRLLVLEGVLLA
jgi:methylated-DNA-[protein]-cysteine S-methyltransferase